METIEVLTRLGGLIAVILAIYGIDAWRREHTSKKRIDLAEETLALFYEARDAIRSIRSPMSFSSETDHVVRGAHESDGAFTARKSASVALKRIDDRRELFSKLHALRYRFMSQMGTDAAKPFGDLQSIVNDIHFSARQLARLWNTDRVHADQTAEEAHYKRVEENEQIFWAGLASADPIEVRVDALIASIEETCRSVIEGRGTLYYLINTRILSKKRPH